MNRGYTKEQYIALANKIKERIPGVALTADVIVGFPGETEEDFQDTLDVVRQIQFEIVLCLCILLEREQRQLLWKIK